MKDKFITDEGLEIPLYNVSYTFTEENPRFKDAFWTQYTLPIDYKYSSELLRTMGHYRSLNAIELKKIHDGKHVFEGRVRKGKIEILEIKKDGLKFQIDSGFESLPNFDTKLEDLPLMNFEVDDIYEHANIIVKHKYPHVNYNFPKIYTDKYNLEDEAWKYFDSMINNRVRVGTSKSFPKNRIENGMDVYNKNIIQPLPYLLYVLKVGFQDAGFTLEGDILHDNHLIQRCIYSAKDYFTTADQKYHKFYIYEDDYFDINQENSEHGPIQFGRLYKKIILDAPGKYRCNVNVRTSVGSWNFGGCNLQIFVNGELFAQLTSGNQNPDMVDSNTIFEVSEEQAVSGYVVEFKYYGVATLNRTNDEDQNIGVAAFNINPIRQNTAEGNPIPYVFNSNRVNLKRAMPEMTFGELVTLIKNWRNYDLEFSGSKAIMNLIKVDKKREPVDFRTFEVEDPLRKYTDKVYFNIKFPEVEHLDVKSIFFNKNGYELNKTKLPETTTEISINAFCLPLISFRSQYTAKAFDENSLMLVYYDGLNNEGDNHAKNPPGLEGDACAKHLLPWYINRLTNMSYKWTFITEKNKIRKFNIRSEIFCYNRKHWIKSWTKRSLNERLYAVEIETETF